MRKGPTIEERVLSLIGMGVDNSVSLAAAVQKPTPQISAMLNLLAQQGYVLRAGSMRHQRRGRSCFRYVLRDERASCGR